MGIRKKVGIKYCGGCNPSYERVEIVERIQKKFKNRFLFLLNKEPGSEIELLVLINGCQRACALSALNSPTLPHFSVTKEGDFENLKLFLKSFEEKGASL